MDWQKVLKYAKKYFKIRISKEEYIELIENYSELRARYLR
jgi:DNA replicative helicase MCM subunit Mcm2 (Cdc46/Mcm family)